MFTGKRLSDKCLSKRPLSVLKSWILIAHIIMPQDKLKSTNWFQEQYDPKLTFDSHVFYYHVIQV